MRTRSETGRAGMSKSACGSSACSCGLNARRNCACGFIQIPETGAGSEGAPARLPQYVSVAINPAPLHVRPDTCVDRQYFVCPTCGDVKDGSLTRTTGRHFSRCVIPDRYSRRAPKQYTACIWAEKKVYGRCAADEFLSFNLECTT
jgi:hypothetical protein